MHITQDLIGFLNEFPHAMVTHPDRHGDIGRLLVWGCLCSLVLSAFFAIVKGL